LDRHAGHGPTPSVPDGAGREWKTRLALTVVELSRLERSTVRLLNQDFSQAVQDGLEQLFFLPQSESEFPVIRVPNLLKQPLMVLLKNA
jgi:hypothetical protein